MDSASLNFILFGLAAAVLSNFSKSAVWRSVVLTAASIVFIALLTKSPLALLPMAGFLLLGYSGLVLIGRGYKFAGTSGIVVIILFYTWLKKYTFLPSVTFLHYPYFILGLSYIFFRVLHLLIEAGDNSEKRPISLWPYLLYALNFTTFVSGPIQRYDEFAEQFAGEPSRLGIRTIGLQFERIVRGFFKVNIVAMILHNLQEDAISQLTRPVSLQHQLAAALCLAVVYPFFLYANFSGYIDIVIALARLMRIRLPENFNRPFSAASVLDFWNRWHITLSSWLKTYVYNPLLLALMRRFSSVALEPFLGVFSFFFTFFLIGIWHGRTSEFAFFGLLTGGGAAVNKLWQVWLTRVMGRKGYKSLAANPFYIAFGRGLNFTWYSFTLFWFWSDWRQIHTIAGTLGPAQWIGVCAGAWIGMTGVFTFWEWLRAALLSIQTSEGPVFTSRYVRVVYVTVFVLAAISVTTLLNAPAPEVVYKTF